jgi:hypothetical protein
MPQNPETGRARGQKIREIRGTGARADKKTAKSGERARTRTKSPRNPENRRARGQKDREIRRTGRARGQKVREIRKTVKKAC